MGNIKWSALKEKRCLHYSTRWWLVSRQNGTVPIRTLLTLQLKFIDEMKILISIAAASCATLPAIWEENLLLALPRNISLPAVTRFAIGTRDTTVLVGLQFELMTCLPQDINLLYIAFCVQFPKLKERFATLKVPAGFTAPEAQILPTSLGHSFSTGHVSSGKIIVQDSRRIFLERVTYDGSGQHAFFWVDRNAQSSLTGWKIPPNNEELVLGRLNSLVTYLITK